MPIEIDEFDKARKTPEIILQYLGKNKTKAFTSREISFNAGFASSNIDIEETLDKMVEAEYLDRQYIRNDYYYALSEKGLKAVSDL